MSTINDDSSQTLAPLRNSPPRHENNHTMATTIGPLLNDELENQKNDLNPDETSHISQSMSDSQAQDHLVGGPATSQIRKPSNSPGPPLPAIAIPAQGEQVQIKTEMTETPVEDRVKPPDNAQATDESRNSSTQPPVLTGRLASKTIEGLKASASASPSPMRPEDSSSLKPRPEQSKKRAAPKKGTASAVKPPAKKRKVDSDSKDSSPSGQRFGTPATSRASGTPVPKNRKQNSATPTRSSSVMNGNEDEDYDDDTEIFCICRKPDDHSIMIGCDGPCEDWFHVKCVEMDQEKSDLVSKWYCKYPVFPVDHTVQVKADTIDAGPNCAALGHESLWKRKCRLEDCPKPARQDDETKFRSKYCSEEHAADFMRRRVFPNTSEKKPTANGSNRKKRHDNYTDNDGNGDGMDIDKGAHVDDDHGIVRGGVLRAGELKALVDGVDSVGAFRKLGDGVLSPPKTASPEAEGGKSSHNAIYTPEESSSLADISRKREFLNARKAMLTDRDKFVAMVAARAKTVLASLKEKEKSLKDICGYDSRLTWSDDELNAWRAAPIGQESLVTGILLPPTPDPNPSAHPEEKDKDKEDEDGEEIGPGVCKKKRCERHRAWFKVQQQDNAFEKDEVRQRLKRLESEEKGIRDRAMIRTLEGGAEGDGEGAL